VVLEVAESAAAGASHHAAVALVWLDPGLFYRMNSYFFSNALPVSWWILVASDRFE